MAEINPPSWLQARTDHKAQQYRRLLGSLVGDDAGVVAPGDLAVTQNGTPNMSVNVAAGRAFILGSETSFQGVYHVDNQATTNLTIAAAHATNTRYDRIVAKVQDAEYSGATNAWSMAVVQGTPAGSPSEPSLPANCIELARVTVAGAVTSITNAAILDRRTSTQQTFTVWTAPTLLNSWVNYGAPFQVAEYRKKGDVVELRGLIKNGTTTTGTVLFTLPAGYRPPNGLVFATIGAQPVSGPTIDFARVDVEADGDVTLSYTGLASFLSLSNIRFSTI